MRCSVCEERATRAFQMGKGNSFLGKLWRLGFFMERGSVLSNGKYEGRGDALILC